MDKPQPTSARVTPSLWLRSLAAYSSRWSSPTLFASTIASNADARAAPDDNRANRLMDFSTVNVTSKHIRTARGSRWRIQCASAAGSISHWPDLASSPGSARRAVLRLSSPRRWW